jgi:hypothetical protein
MKPSFIPPEARPPVNETLARQAWEVAVVLESLARRRAPGEPEKEMSDAAPTDRTA